MPNEPVNIFEYEAIAREKLEQGHYDFIAGAATDEITLRRTRAVLDSINLRPKMLTDISQRDLSTTVLGQRISFPVMLDPAGNHEAAHPDAELATARAAGKAGTVMVVSSHAARTTGRRRRGRHRPPVVPAVPVQGPRPHPRDGRPRRRGRLLRPLHHR